MGNYTKSYDKIRLTTYEEVRKLIDKVEGISNLFDVTKKSYNFNVSYGDTSCSVKSITDFIEQAYGRNNFGLISMQMMYFLPEGQFFSINYLCGLRVTATSNMLLEKVVDKLNFDLIKQSIVDTQIYKNTSFSALSSSSSANTMVVQGDGNCIVTGSGTATYNCEKNDKVGESKKKNFLSHPLIAGIIAAVVAGIILMFSFWESLVSWIEQLFI